MRIAFADKPICTSTEQLKEIAALAEQTNLCVGCQLDMRDAANTEAVNVAL